MLGSITFSADEPPTATCPDCGLSYYQEQGRTKCPRCEVILPTLLRDKCGGCGLPCTDELCLYCEGLAEADGEMDNQRRQFAASVTQLTADREMLTQQLAARDRVIADLTQQRGEALGTAASLREELDALRRDAANQEFMKLTWIDRYHALADQQQRLRRVWTEIKRWATITACSGVLAWQCWDLLPHWSPSTWSTVVVGLGALLVGRRWPGRKVSLPDSHELRCLECGAGIPADGACPRCEARCDGCSIVFARGCMRTTGQGLRCATCYEELPGSSLPEPTPVKSTG